VKKVMLLLFIFIISCSEGNPENPFEGNQYQVSVGKLEQYISTDSIKLLPNSINSDTTQQFIYNFHSDRDSIYLAQFNSAQFDSLNFLYVGLRKINLFHYYESIPKYALNIYKSLYFMQRVLSVVDDGLLPLNMNGLRNGGLLVVTKTSVDTTSKFLSIKDTTSDSLVNMTLTQKKDLDNYSAEFFTSDTFFYSTNIKVSGLKYVNTVVYNSISKYGNLSIIYRQNLIDTNIIASFVLKSPIKLVNGFFSSDDSIYIKGFVFENGYSLIRIYINNENTSFRDIVRDSGVVDFKKQLYEDSTARAIFFWSIDNNKPVDTLSIFTPIDSSRIDDVEFNDIDLFYSLNHYSVVTGVIPYFKDELHLFYIRDNLYLIRNKGQFTYYGEEVPNSIKKYLDYKPYLDSINI